MSVAETHTDRQILQQHTLHFHSLHHAAKMTQICRHSDYSDAWAIFTSLQFTCWSRKMLDMVIGTGEC